MNSSFASIDAASDTQPFDPFLRPVRILGAISMVREDGGIHNE